MELNLSIRSFLYSIIICAFSASPAWAQCNGVFPANTLCGNFTQSPAPPTAGGTTTASVTTNFYTNGSTGSDSNNCSLAAPCLTIQHTINVAVQILNPSMTQVIVNVAAGTYVENLNFLPPIPESASSFLSLPTFQLIGAGSTTIIDGAANDFSRGWTITSVKMQNSTGGNPVFDCNGCYAQLNAIEWGANANGTQVNAHNGGNLHMGGASWTISGSATHHWQADSNSFISIRGKTITLVGTPNFSVAFAQADGGRLQVDGNTFSGSATGKRFIIADGGSAQIGTTSLTYFPGNSAGTVDNGSSYGSVAGVSYGTTFANLPSPVIGTMGSITDGLAANCGDTTCTTFGTTVTGGGGALHLLVWNNGTNWTLMGK
jgi:hypothetical protein